jgi:predicted nucleic acid-binding protein
VAFIVVYDANVLYPAPLRDLLLTLAGMGEFQARYSDEILDEVFENLAANRPDLDELQLQRTRELMEWAIPDVIVTGHMTLVDSLQLPDPNDRHVLAARIRAGAQVIVTNDKKDFPTPALEPYGIEAQNADVFCHHLADLRADVLVDALHRMSKRLNNPPKTPHDILDTLQRNGLVQTASIIGPLLGLHP